MSNAGARRVIRALLAVGFGRGAGGVQLTQLQPSSSALGGAVPTGGGEEVGKAALASCRFPPPASSLLERAAVRERGMRPRGAHCLRALAASPPLVWSVCGKGRCSACSCCSCVHRGTGGEVKEPVAGLGTLVWFNLHSVPFFFF